MCFPEGETEKDCQEKERVSSKLIGSSQLIAKPANVRCCRGVDIDTSSSHVRLVLRYLDKLLGNVQVHFAIPLKFQGA